MSYTVLRSVSEVAVLHISPVLYDDVRSDASGILVLGPITSPTYEISVHQPGKAKEIIMAMRKASIAIKTPTIPPVARKWLTEEYEGYDDAFILKSKIYQNFQDFAKEYAAANPIDKSLNGITTSVFGRWIHHLFRDHVVAKKKLVDGRQESIYHGIRGKPLERN